MRFADPWVLIMLVAVPLLHRWWKRRNRPAEVTFSVPVPKEARKGSPLRILLPIKYFAYAMFVLAAARPQSSYKQTERTVSGIDIMMVLDFSASMNIEDLAERSRMDVAKETMQDFIKARENDRIGFVAFSGEPLTLAPPTLDYGLVLSALRDFEIGTLKDGTGIGDGLALAVNHLRSSKAKSRVIILLTDGENNVGQVDPVTAGDLAAGYGIKVYTIAIGREGRVRVPQRHKGIFGNTITTYQYFENALNTELLEQISKQTHARSYRVTDPSTLESVFKEIDQLEKTDIKTRDRVHYEEQFQKPLKLGLLAFVVEQVLARGALGWLP